MKYTGVDTCLFTCLFALQVHSTVRRRWNEGDLELRADMDQVAKLAEEGKKALEERNHSKLAYLMDKNFDLRRCVEIHCMHRRVKYFIIIFVMFYSSHVVFTFQRERFQSKVIDLFWGADSPHLSCMK